MIFQRGNPMDYERWAADKGMENWDFAHCLPYFKKMENATGVPDDKIYRGHDGPLYLEKGPAKNPLFKAFFDAAVAAGFNRTDDVNGFSQEGFGPFDKNVKKGRRWSSARAYLHPVMHRKNLTIQTRHQVHRVIFEGDKGVLSTQQGSQSLEIANRHGLFALDSQQVLDYLFEGTALYVTPQSSLYALTVADALQRSAQTGELIALEEKKR
jgi:choline dehydrogenase-like flavoprotein